MSPQPSPRLISDRAFVLEHTFRAPAAKVFAGYTDPTILPRWWAPKGGSVEVQQMDVRPGGAWRFLQRFPGGKEMVFYGTYLEVQPVTRLVYTFHIEGQPGGEITAAVELRESGGVTHLTLTNTTPSQEFRDSMIKYGAVAGAQVAWEELAKVLAEGTP